MMPKMFLAIEVCHITCNFGPPCMDELYIDVFNLFVGYKYLSQKCGLNSTLAITCLRRQLVVSIDFAQ